MIWDMESLRDRQTIHTSHFGDLASFSASQSALFNLATCILPYRTGNGGDDEKRQPVLETKREKEAHILFVLSQRAIYMVLGNIALLPYLGR